MTALAYVSWPAVRRTVVTTLFLLAPLAVDAVLAQEGLAARLLATGDRLERDGKVEQARDAWSDVVEQYPDSISAPTALDRLGSSFYPVESFELQGQIGGDAQLAARPYFETLARDFRTAPEAPHAAWKLGLLFSDPVSPFRDLDQAYGWFSRIVTVHEDSELLDAGLYGLGSVLVAQRRFRQALRPLGRLLAERPRSETVDRARFLIAHCLVRRADFEPAIRVYQSLIDVAPETTLARDARDRITHLVRLLGGRGNPAARHYDPARLSSVQPRLGANDRLRAVSSLTVDPDNNLVLTDTRGDYVYVLDPSGRLISRTAVRRPSSAWAGEGSLLIASGEAVMDSGRSRVLLLPDGRGAVSDLGFIARDPLHGLVAWDRRSGDVLRFDRSFAFDRTLVTGDQQRVDAVAMRDDGALYTLDARERTVTAYPLDGPSRQIRLSDGSYLRKPQHIAVDFIGNVFVLDTSSREIGVVRPDGSLLFRLESGRSDTDPFPDPVALAVNARGEILLYDERFERVVVLR